MDEFVSIIICTRNRAASLEQTLASIGRVYVPADWRLELIIVDNASTDETSYVAAMANAWHPVVYIHETRHGLAVSRNTGLKAASGSVVLFTDDDMRPPVNWVEGMCGPIFRGEADAVAGGIKIAPHLLRGWMDLWHRAWLASTECLDDESPARMIGGNMAFRKSALSLVPGFDPELGAGALGMAEETLFSLQLKQAGMRIAAKMNIVCEHHFEKSRLSREAFLDTAMKLGRSDAYIAHHWEHQSISQPRAALMRSIMRLEYYRLRNRGCKRRGPVAVWEMQLIKDILFYQSFMSESKRPRNYDRHGLRRLDTEPSMRNEALYLCELA